MELKLANLEKHKNLITNLALIVLALMVANNIFKGQTRGIDALKARKDTEIKKNEVLASIKVLEEEFEVYKNTLNKKDVPPEAINALASQGNVRIVSFRPVPKKEEGLYTKYSLDLVIQAKDYHTLGKFISSLESSPEFYFVDICNLRPIGEKQIEANLTISRIFLKG